MHVLLAIFDLFKDVGGGQTFYRNLILRNPQIQFTYLRSSEALEASRPDNTTAIPCPNRFVMPPESSSCDLEVPNCLYFGFARANDVARAVAGRCFDVVDLPDYEQFGLFLRDAFDHYHVSVDRVMLGMHGRLSTSFSLNWSDDERECIDLAQVEKMQYQTVDARYFISAKYRDEWLAIDPVPAHLLDPLWFFDVPRLQAYQDRVGAPDLNFVGRGEKLKGPDIFIHLAWWLPRSCYRTANLIGPTDYDRKGTASALYLEKMIRLRRLIDVNLVRCMTPAELVQVYRSKSVTVVPSVYDTLNLVALESLLSGCPTVIGSGAGVCRYLRERFPELPFELIDVDNWYESVPRLAAILRDYGDYRQTLRDAIARQDILPRGLRLTDVYEAPAACDQVLRDRVTDWYQRLSRWTSRSSEGQERRLRCA
jgi:glycosyltransferase involved in cell wall biosynthesis